ncbi:MAG TPA: diguanylate cyclase, partial [Gammaproteobacteria bacterium]|nr:diguanylate cyclase [Gammaproteobacteria bacterium]
RDSGSEASPGAVLLQLVDLLSLPRRLNPDLGDIRGRLRKASGTDLPESLLKDLAALLQDAADAPEPPGGLRGMLSKSPPNPGRPLRILLDELIVPAELRDTLDRLSSRLAEKGTEDTAAEVSEEIASLLNDYLTEAPPPSRALRRPLSRLVEALDMEEEGDDERTRDLQARIASGPRAGELPRILADTAELTAQARESFEQERAGLESFLQHLLQNLEELENRFQTTSTLHSSDRQQDREHSEELDVQMEGLESDLQASEDLEGLKQVVRGRLKTVRERIEAHRRAKEERDHELEAEVDTLRSQLAEMEQKSQQLQARLREEHRRALTDPLTGLLNRLGYEEAARRILAQWQEGGDPLSLVVLDVDRFKDLNDRYGHQVGDKALQTIGNLLTGALPSPDCTLARYGGEEFVVLLPGLEGGGAKVIAERMRQRLAEATFTSRGERFRITLSAGVAEFREGDSLKGVFQRADRALLAAKESGRDLVQPEDKPD